MRKYFFGIMILIAGLSAFAFGGKAPKSVAGHIKFYGNAPFEYPGIETVDGYLYAIQTEKDSGVSIEEIKASQGKMIELTGRVEKKEKLSVFSLRDGTFIVSEFRILE